ncbi:two-component system, chemotaxis family, sensor kinase CheA [Methylococcales bacterium]|nr:two-component system, chemotaxis family, sensor kinase CheA [Methylococcales bacterium]
MQEALTTFTIESSELLVDMEAGLMALETLEDPAETINAIFRAAHTIKGSSGVFGLDHIVRFTHVLESVLDKLRDGKLGICSELIAALLPCCDHLNLLVREIADGRLEENPEYSVIGRQLLQALLPYLEPSAAAETRVSTVPDNSERVQSLGGDKIESGNWHLFLQFHPNCLRDGMDPLSFIRYLTTIGEIVHLTTFSHTMPEAEQMDPESNYLGFEIVLKSDADKATIDGAFDFVRDGSHIHILPLENRIPYYVELIESLTEDNAQLGELLIKSGVITQRELEDGLKAQTDRIEAQQPSQRIGEILVEKQVVQQPIVSAALEKQKQLKDNKARENQSIRVDAERLDKLIDLIGELVISTAAASLRGMKTGDVALQEANANVISLVEEVRDSALQLRMVPIGTTFSRFQRVVRDVSKELGKDIKLVISGAETEVDKSVVEKIGDPLMHLVRNAMDHGIERAEVRAERGKPVQGTLRLNAYHSSGNIVIEVGDDGGGLDRDKIMAKAVERELIPAGATLSDQEIYALIFEPGFSTADQVSSLSGRGVGMDVVKRNITELRGIIHVDSQPGQGTTLRIHLPLTLAIIDGFLVGVGDTSYVIPLDRVVECVELPVDDNRDYMELRGEVLPFIRLRQLFHKTGPVSRRQNIIVVEHLDLKAGLVVDRLMGELQTVIKPLGKLFGHVQGLGGSTILGSGEVALIIDVPTMLRQQAQGSVTG